MDASAEPSTAARTPRTVIPLALAGAMLSVSLGVYGRTHEPTGTGITTLWFPSMLAMKSALASVAMALGVVQLLTVLAMFGRAPSIRRVLGGALGRVHRWSGTAAFLVSLPVAYHCLWSLGFRTVGARPLAHGLFGCFFYGAFATKLLALRTRHLPRWALPAAGGLVLTSLTGAWLTSALWFFGTS